MHDLICEVVSYFALSCDIGKLSVNDKSLTKTWES